MSLRNAIPRSLLERDPELAKLVEVLDDGLRSFNPGDRLGTNFDFLRMDAQVVEKWLKAFGWKQNWQIDKKRLLKALLTLYRRGGSAQGIIKAIQEFSGIENVAVYEAWPDAYAKGQSLTDAEKCNVTVRLSYRPYGAKTWDYKPLAEQICSFLKPIHAKVTVIIQQNQIQDIPAVYSISRVGAYSIFDLAYTPPEKL